MADLLPFLKSLLSVSGISAYETPAARLIEQCWAPLADKVELSRLGSVHALKRGSGTAPRRSVLISAHMDSIGLIAKKIVDGFIYVAGVGSVDVRVLPGTPVLVHTRSGELTGVAVMPNAKLLPETQHGKFPDLSHLVVDTGLTAVQVARRVHAGDLISFDTAPLEMSGEMLSGHSLDNRASIAALTLALEELHSKSPLWDVWAVATTQEELNYAGAATSAFHLQPDLAIAVDVTFGQGSGTSGWDSFPVGGGPTLAIGPSIHPFLHKRFKELAEKMEIPYAVEPVPAASNTDADALQVARQGIPTMVLGIPLRYMHTPVEAVLLKDIHRTGRLLAEFALSLESDFIEKIVWE